MSNYKNYSNECTRVDWIHHNYEECLYGNTCSKVNYQYSINGIQICYFRFKFNILSWFMFPMGAKLTMNKRYLCSELSQTHLNKLMIQVVYLARSQGWRVITSWMFTRNQFQYVIPFHSLITQTLAIMNFDTQTHTSCETHTQILHTHSIYYAYVMLIHSVELYYNDKYASVRGGRATTYTLSLWDRLRRHMRVTKTSDGGFGATNVVSRVRKRRTNNLSGSPVTYLVLIRLRWSLCG